MHEVKLLGPWAFVLMSCSVAGAMGAAALALLVGLRWRPPAFLWLLGPWVLCLLGAASTLLIPEGTDWKPHPLGEDSSRCVGATLALPLDAQAKPAEPPKVPRPLLAVPASLPALALATPDWYERQGILRIALHAPLPHAEGMPEFFHALGYGTVSFRWHARSSPEETWDEEEMTPEARRFSKLLLGDRRRPPTMEERPRVLDTPEGVLLQRPGEAPRPMNEEEVANGLLREQGRRLLFVPGPTWTVQRLVELCLAAQPLSGEFKPCDLQAPRLEGVESKRSLEMNVHWKPYVWKKPQPVDPIEVERLEKTWGVQLPEEYKQIAPLCHGMTPVPNIFDIGRGGNVITCLLTLTAGSQEKEYAISTMYDLIKPHVPPGIFPFGTTPGGENICFDYRDAPPGQPRIVLVTIEMEIYPIANSFREFLEGLHELRD